jgi:ABC-type transport system involved in cytochrome c biogenesis permease component
LAIIMCVLFSKCLSLLLQYTCSDYGFVGLLIFLWFGVAAFVFVGAEAHSLAVGHRGYS